MIKLEYSRPNTIGTYYSETFDSYPEEQIERLCEKLADAGWELSELSGSSSRQGTIECTHESEADVKLITWQTIVECSHCGDYFDHQYTLDDHIEAYHEEE